MMKNQSKPIRKTDDESKQFIINSLKGDVTRGFDIDSIYYHNDKWYIFEYLKCESEKVTPYSSDPKYYPQNWKKFYLLYSVARKLNGVLLLINYSTRDKDKNEVKVMRVLDLDYEKAKSYSKKDGGLCEYMKLESWQLTMDEFSERLRKFNAVDSLPENF